MAGGSFSQTLASFAADTPKQADQIYRKIVLGLGSLIVYGSPVDTGRFRANWQFGVDKAPSGDLTKTDKSGAATIGGFATALPANPTQHVLYLANNLPYARRLEYGWSKQAPGGMVRVSMLKVEALVAQAVASTPSGGHP
jgi:hypothetical protein